MSATAAALWLPISISKVNIKTVEPHGIFASTAAAPAIDLVQVWPVDNSGNIVYLTSGPESSAGSISALLSVKFKITNKESKTLTVNKIEYGCSGNGINKKSVSYTHLTLPTT